jgi:SIR2-like domain
MHGSVAVPDSLVLTAADYARFEERNTYLAAKLMTIFVEHPVVFLGYSLSDRNVCSILRSIAGCLTSSNIRKLRDQLIFVEWVDGERPAISESSIMIGAMIVPVISVKVPDFTDVYTTLTELRRTFPEKLLGRLKEQVYDLVLTDDPAPPSGGYRY